MGELPQTGAITAIEPQKTRKQRVSVFIDGEFGFGLDAEVAARFGLRVGSVVDREVLQKMLGEDEYKRALEKIYRMLAARPRSRSEVEARLQRELYPDFVIARVIASCQRHGYLDDREFARQYSRSRINTRPVGKDILKLELRKRGISNALIAEVVAEIYTQTSEIELATRLAEKKIVRLRELPRDKSKQKLAAFLRNRGFDWETIRDIVVKYFA